jgi:hypothetical protein
MAESCVRVECFPVGLQSGHRNVESLNKEIAGASAIIETNTALLNYAKVSCWESL